MENITTPTKSKYLVNMHGNEDCGNMVFFAKPVQILKSLSTYLAVAMNIISTQYLFKTKDYQYRGGMLVNEFRTRRKL